MHSKDFHDNIDILDGFEFYDRNVDCRLQKCPSNKINRHFHCTRPNCNYSFVQYSTMAMHNQKHLDDSTSSNINTSSSSSSVNNNNNNNCAPIDIIKIKNEPIDEKPSASTSSTSIVDQSNNDVTHQFRAINLSHQQQQQLQQHQSQLHQSDNSKVSGKCIIHLC